MEDKGNQELKDILKDILNAKVDTKESATAGLFDVDKFESMMKNITSGIEKGMPNYSKEVQDLLRPVLDEAKMKGTKDYIYKKHSEDNANNSN